MFYISRPLLLVGIFLFSTVGVLAQDCSIPFDTTLFEVQEEHDIYYGSAIAYDGSNVDLRLNIFKPIGDAQTERPLIIVVHGGGFFEGHRDDRNALCYELASMGWAAATVSYRLDFYGTWLLNSPWAYDPAEIVRAAYRAQQDVRGATRFLKARSAIDSTSTENVMLMGFSAGAISALHAAYVDDPSEKPPSCNNIDDVFYLFSSHSRPDLGAIEGTLNLNGMSDEVLAVASNYGGLLDTNLVSGPLDPALYLYHQTGDPIVGCGHQQGLWDMPLGVGDNYPFLFGSCVTDVHIQNLNPDPGRYFYHEYVGNEHAVHDPDGILQEEIHFLRELFCPPNVRLAVRVFLEGPYDTGIGLMVDSLRALPSFPLIEPYSDMGYTHMNGGAELIETNVLAATGNDAIVDWVVLELRDALDPSIVLDTRSALLQRDGDVVDIDGSSPVTFTSPPSDYFVAVRHRNHLGVMSFNALVLSEAVNDVDFTVASTPTFGIDARKNEGAVEVLWAGDANFDGVIKYTGGSNDRDVILTAIGGTVPTNTVNAYRSEDINMDGLVKYTGTDNDRDIVLQTIGGIVPTNIRSGTLP